MSWLFGRKNTASSEKTQESPGNSIEDDISKQLDNLLEDSPASRAKIQTLESDLVGTTQSLKRLIKISKQYQALGNAFKEVAIQFGQELLDFNYEGLPAISDSSSPLSSIAKGIGQAIIDVNDYQSMLMVQMGNVFTQPLEQFLEGELKESKDQIKQYHRLRGRYDQSISKFSHIKKNDLEKIPEAEHELMLNRNEYQHASLQFVATLGRLEAESKLQVMERACAFLYSEKAFFSQGTGNYCDFDKGVVTIDVFVTGISIHSDIDKRLSELSEKITSVSF